VVSLVTLNVKQGVYDLSILLSQYRDQTALV